MPRPAWMLPEVGTLYNPSGDAIPGTLPPLYTQPGGPGTPVFPQPYDSAPGEFEPPLIATGMYSAGCGHIFNCNAVFKQFDIITQKDKAIICCPVCTYILAIEDYDIFQNYIATPILVV
jgi:hypothetical protein